MSESIKSGVENSPSLNQSALPTTPANRAAANSSRSEQRLFSENALAVLKRRYLQRDKDGNIQEKPEDLLWRVANAIAEADIAYTNRSNVKRTAQQFYDLIAAKDFMPNSPTLMNAGKELGQLSACFVLPIEDSMESIFQTLKEAALIHKSGGGTGFSFSRLRPQKSIVKSTSGVASGPVSFMKVFNSSTEAVKQGGTRRGANMGILRVDHPDILDFINCKLNGNELTNFNISVAVTDDFMEKVRRHEHYELINPHDHSIAGTLNAFDVFKLIARNAWLNGDPGIVYIDHINKLNPTPKLGDIEATNPCGEQPLLPNEACNLGSINLANFIVEEKIDYVRLGQVVDTAVHFLDNVIDVNKYPLKKIDSMVKKTRKIGLGVMGLADLLFSLRIPYNSDEALQKADEIMRFIYTKAQEASIKLGASRGTFPAWNESIYFPDGPKLRNSTFITIAPTGTISMISDCSSGIEPIFSLVFTKHVMDGTNLIYANPYFEKACREAGIYSQELMQRVQEEGSIQNFSDIPEHIRNIFVTAHDISPEWHVRTQAAFQKWVDSAVSKTCNFPNSSTVDDVMEAYWLAYEASCKGITIYRDGSRDEQVLYVGDKSQKTAKEAGISPAFSQMTQTIQPRIRPQETHGVTKRIRTGQGTLYVTINEDEHGLCEVFTNIGKAGSQAQVESEAISRLISLALRSGIDVQAVIRQLKGIGGPMPIWENGTQILSTPDAIAKAIEWYIAEQRDGKKIKKHQPSISLDETALARPRPVTAITENILDFKVDNKKLITTCPDCGSTVYHESGCVTCPSCGYSKC